MKMLGLLALILLGLPTHSEAQDIGHTLEVPPPTPPTFIIDKLLADADEIVEEAKAQAKEQHKIIFMDFDASWCEPCHQMNKFLDAPEIHPIVDKYFVLITLSVLEEKRKHTRPNTPGGAEFLVKFHGANKKGVIDSVPFIVFLDANGEPIVNSKPLNKKGEEGPNIGYPSDPTEIHWFMDMLQKAVPTMTAEESNTIRKWLNKHGDQYHPA
jgi:thioredoxin-related protein